VFDELPRGHLARISRERSSMTTPTHVQALNINDLKRYSSEARVNQPVLTSRDIVTRMNCYEPGQVTPFHLHPDDDEVVFCVEGRGAVTFEDRAAVPLTPGTIVNLPAGLAHGIEAAPDSRMVVLYWASVQYTSVRLERADGYRNIRLPGEQPPSPAR
jgi:quercetin dioxygenase-like cupin family protein